MKMKSLKAQFIGAIAMVLVAAIAMGSSTYAWFAMNTEVTATGMQVKATAEGGLVISDVQANTWSSTASAHATSATSLVPTSHGIVASTDDGWYHNSSVNADNATAYATNEYSTLNLAYTDSTGGKSAGIGYVDSDHNSSYTDAADKAYHLKNVFFIKTSAEAMTNTNLVIKNVEVTSGTTMIDLDASLRVAIVAGGNTYIYAPIANADGTTPTYTYHVNGNTTATVAYEPTKTTDGGTGTGAYLAGKDLACSGVTAIPAYTTASPLEVDVYIYYEGEDAACKSTNINGAPVDALNVTITFGTADVPSSNP